MTLAQAGLLFDAERRFNDPKKSGPKTEAGTLTDLAMFAAMKAG